MNLKVECKRSFDISEYVFDQHEMRFTGIVHVQASLLDGTGEVGLHQGEIP